MNTTEITDAKVARKAGIPLKMLKEHPEFLEDFRKYYGMERKGTNRLETLTFYTENVAAKHLELLGTHAEKLMEEISKPEELTK